MPPKVKGLLFLTVVFAGAAATAAQQQPPTANSPIVISPNLPHVPNAVAVNAPPIAAAPIAPTTHDKLVRARAMIAARQLPAAAHELEKLKKDQSADAAVQTVVRTMLIGVYLEQPNHERAKELLEESFDHGKNRRKTTENLYLPVAGQVIKAAYNQLGRYKTLGFSLSDPKLPAEAITDLDRWRKMLEMICEQSKKLSLDEKQSAESLAVLEQAAEARGALARDDYEAAQWRNAMNDTREMIADSQNKVTDVDGALVDMKNAATVTLPTAAPVGNLDSSPTAATANSSANQLRSAPVSNQTAPQTTTDAAQPAVKPLQIVNASTVSGNTPATQPKAETAAINNSAATAVNDAAKPELKPTDKNQIMRVASLVEAATRKVNPNYPPMARSARVGGVVKVEIVVDEQGEVSEVKTSEGPELLRRAATDAVRRWKFKPAVRDGQPVKMSGFVNFNFAL